MSERAWRPEERIPAGLRKQAEGEKNQANRERLLVAASSIEGLVKQLNALQTAYEEKTKECEELQVPSARTKTSLIKKTTLSRLERGALLWMENNPENIADPEDRLMPVVFLEYRENLLDYELVVDFAGNHWNAVKDYNVEWRLWRKKPTWGRMDEEPWAEPPQPWE